MENKASLKAATKNGFTPLHIAAKYGNMNVANILLQKESKLDVQGKVRVYLYMYSNYIELGKKSIQTSRQKKNDTIFLILCNFISLILFLIVSVIAQCYFSLNYQENF